MNVSVIIPTLNEEALVGRAIRRAQRAGAAEVIIADGGSGDETVAIARNCQCQVVSAERGRGQQQNAGARLARGEVLLFQHADCWLSAAAIHQLTAALARSTRLGGAFTQDIEAPGALYRLLEVGNAARARWLGMPYGDQGIFLRRETFRQLGGFPEQPLMEDVQLMQRLRRRSWPLLLPGPLHVSPRRWQRHGVIRQTLRNWMLLTAFILGVPPRRLVPWYASPEGQAASRRDACPIHAESTDMGVPNPLRITD